jgi:hypothetical protein
MKEGYTLKAMTGQVEIKVTAPTLRDPAILDAAIDRAADVIYDGYPEGGPCVSGDLRSGELSLLLSVDIDKPEEWMPQLAVLVQAVGGSVGEVNITPFVEAVPA